MQRGGRNEDYLCVAGSTWQIKSLGQRNTEAVLEKVGYLGVHLQERSRTPGYLI